MKFRLLGAIRCLNTRLKRKVGNIPEIMELDDLSGTNGFIIGYIHKSSKPVYQRDLEHEFGITRSTASKVLSLMEKKCLIERRSVSSDARLKEIVLTQKAIDLNNRVISALERYDKKLLSGFTKTEIELFYSFIKRIENNMELED